jgi:Concanavalin A-like lectin/glucanases superfamily
MNSLVIILGILIIFLIYLLVVYLTSSATTVNTSADFTTAIPTITGNNLPSATNVSYAYGIWLYVQNWDPSSQKTILYRPNNFKLYLDKLSPTLYCDVVLSDSTAQTPSIKTVMITNTFPLQKWVCIILSIDNQYLDCYLDGKLVLSHQIMKLNKGTDGTNSVIAPIQPKDSTTSPLYLGNSGDPAGGTFTAGTTGGGVGSGWSANALLVTRWTTPVDPQTAWNWYMKGNGQSSLGGVFGNYNVNYTILKNNIAIVNNKPLF